MNIFHAAIAALLLAAAPATFTSCSDDDDNGTPEAPGNNGISSPSWGDRYIAQSNGETAIFTFTASGPWSATSNVTWCEINPANGTKSNSRFAVTIAPNDTDKERTAIITIKVTGASGSARLQIVQNAGSSGSGTYSDVNRWMQSYMSTNYLWNEPLANYKPDYSLSYDKFLEATLDYVDADNHRNRDDGHWADGRREYYYSFIESDAPTSRAAGDKVTGSGVMFMGATIIDENNNVALLPAMVAPGSPAAKAGIKRGDIITRIGGSRITTSNYQNMADRLYSGNVTVTTFNIESQTENAAVRIEQATFTDPAIYEQKILTLTNGKKVGYIAYMGFDISFDEQLIDIFNQFKAQGVSELILDLRYNGGGHVLSSLVLGTLIAGNDKKDQIYNKTTYNAARTAKGEYGEYKIGNPQTPERNYTKITNALNASLGLKTIYVIGTEDTASASELIINGLRGLDITVNLIGTTTNGKNVGMEAISRRFGNYEFLFAPITFYSQNAKGFKDYANGFTPDLVLDETEYFYGDFGSTEDPLIGKTIEWIANGSKPDVSTMSRTTASRRIASLTLGGKRPQRRIRGMIALPERNGF